MVADKIVLVLVGCYSDYFKFYLVARSVVDDKLISDTVAVSLGKLARQDSLF